MKKGSLSPFQAAFWLSDEERLYLLVICAIFLIGLIARYFYLKSDAAEVYRPPDIEEIESN